MQTNHQFQATQGDMSVGRPIDSEDEALGLIEKFERQYQKCKQLNKRSQTYLLRPLVKEIASIALFFCSLWLLYACASYSLTRIWAFPQLQDMLLDLESNKKFLVY